MNSANSNDKCCATCSYWCGKAAPVSPGSSTIGCNAMERAKCSKKGYCSMGPFDHCFDWKKRF